MSVAELPFIAALLGLLVGPLFLFRWLRKRDERTVTFSTRPATAAFPPAGQRERDRMRGNSEQPADVSERDWLRL